MVMYIEPNSIFNGSYLRFYWSKLIHIWQFLVEYEYCMGAKFYCRLGHQNPLFLACENHKNYFYFDIYSVLAGFLWFCCFQMNFAQGFFIFCLPCGLARPLIYIYIYIYIYIRVGHFYTFFSKVGSRDFFMLLGLRTCQIQVFTILRSILGVPHGDFVNFRVSRVKTTR